MELRTRLVAPRAIRAGGHAADESARAWCGPRIATREGHNFGGVGPVRIMGTTDLSIAVLGVVLLH